MAHGFTVDRIDVTGEGRLSEADVRAAVGIYEGDYFFGTDLERAQRNTESLPWVDRAVVRRLWPNRIVVQLVETTPYALHQQDGVIYLANRDGTLISDVAAQPAALSAGLKRFIGMDAVVQSDEIVPTLKRHAALWSQTETLTRQASGRWDVTFADGTLLRLPRETYEANAALVQFARLQARTDLARYSVVDLRLTDRITLTPATPRDA